MAAGTIRRALSRLGDAVTSEVEFVIVGGAAGLLTGVLPGAVTTADVDAVCFRPPQEIDAVLKAADEVAEGENMERGWLSVDA